MCYMVTGADSVVQKVFNTLPDARGYAEDLAHNGATDVRIWLLTHSVTIEPRAIWKEHAKGLSGSGKE